MIIFKGRILRFPLGVDGMDTETRNETKVVEVTGEIELRSVGWVGESLSGVARHIWGELLRGPTLVGAVQGMCQRKIGILGRYQQHEPTDGCIHNYNFQPYSHAPPLSLACTSTHASLTRHPLSPLPRPFHGLVSTPHAMSIHDFSFIPSIHLCVHFIYFCTVSSLELWGHHRDDWWNQEALFYVQDISPPQLFSPFSFSFSFYSSFFPL